MSLAPARNSVLSMLTAVQRRAFPASSSTDVMDSPPRPPSINNTCPGAPRRRPRDVENWTFNLLCDQLKKVKPDGFRCPTPGAWYSFQVDDGSELGYYLLPSLQLRYSPGYDGLGFPDSLGKRKSLYPCPPIDRDALYVEVLLDNTRTVQLLVESTTNYADLFRILLYTANPQAELEHQPGFSITKLMAFKPPEPYDRFWQFGYIPPSYLCKQLFYQIILRLPSRMELTIYSPFTPVNNRPSFCILSVTAQDSNFWDYPPSCVYVPTISFVLFDEKSLVRVLDADEHTSSSLLVSSITSMFVEGNNHLISREYKFPLILPYSGISSTGDTPRLVNWKQVVNLWVTYKEELSARYRNSIDTAPVQKVLIPGQFRVGMHCNMPFIVQCEDAAELAKPMGNLCTWTQLLPDVSTKWMSVSFFCGPFSIIELLIPAISPSRPGRMKYAAGTKQLLTVEQLMFFQTTWLNYDRSRSNFSIHVNVQISIQQPVNALATTTKNLMLEYSGLLCFICTDIGEGALLVPMCCNTPSNNHLICWKCWTDSIEKSWSKDGCPFHSLNADNIADRPLVDCTCARCPFCRTNPAKVCAIEDAVSARRGEMGKAAGINLDLKCECGVVHDTDKHWLLCDRRSVVIHSTLFKVNRVDLMPGQMDNPRLIFNHRLSRVLEDVSYVEKEMLTALRNAENTIGNHPAYNLPGFPFVHSVFVRGASIVYEFHTSLRTKSFRSAWCSLSDLDKAYLAVWYQQTDSEGETIRTVLELLLLSVSYLGVSTTYDGEDDSDDEEESVVDLTTAETFRDPTATEPLVQYDIRIPIDVDEEEDDLIAPSPEY